MRPPYGLTRGVFTLVGVALSGFLVWLAFEVIERERGDVDPVPLGDYWAFVGLLVAAGLTIALSQLLGGWTKWGWPRISVAVFVLGFVPVLIVVGWVVLANQPEEAWLADETRRWADDIGLGGALGDVSRFLPILAFGLGLVLGLTFDTTGPRREPLLRRRRAEAVTPTVPPTSHPLAAADAGASEPAPEPREEPPERPGARAPGVGEGGPPPRDDG